MSCLKVLSCLFLAALACSVSPASSQSPCAEGSRWNDGCSECVCSSGQTDCTLKLCSVMDSLDEVANKFLSFLRDSNYGPPVTHKDHNLHNIYQLLFVPEMRYTAPLAASDVTEYMLQKGLLRRDGENYTVVV